jgi:hypothetical protein
MFDCDCYLRFLISAKDVPLCLRTDQKPQIIVKVEHSSYWSETSNNSHRDFWSVRRMFYCDGYLRFLISTKNVPLWRLFKVSDQCEECSTVTVIWGFSSVRRMFHFDDYLRFMISTKNVPLWRLFEISTVEHSSYWSETSNNRHSGTFFVLIRNLK